MPLSISSGGRLSPQRQSSGFDLNPLLIQEAEASAQKRLFHLIMIQVPGEVGDNFVLVTEDSKLFIPLVDCNHDVVYSRPDGSPVTYAAFPVKFTGASISSDGTVDKASLVVANISRDIMHYVEMYNGLRNMRVKVKTVFENFVDHIYTVNADGSVSTQDNPAKQSDAYIEDEYLIDTYAANEQIVTFQLDPIVDLEIRLPRRRYMVDSCYWNYKHATTCKYKETNPTFTQYGGVACDKTFKACKLRQNQENFGGFPGISAQRRILL